MQNGETENTELKEKNTIWKFADGDDLYCGPLCYGTL
jgi:hypothetical protein